MDISITRKLAITIEGQELVDVLLKQWTPEDIGLLLSSLADKLISGDARNYGRACQEIAEAVEEEGSAGFLRDIVSHFKE